MARRVFLAWAFVAILALEPLGNLALEAASDRGEHQGYSPAPRGRFPGVVQLRGPGVQCTGVFIGPQDMPSSHVLTSAVCAEAVGPTGTVVFSANGTFDQDSQEIAIHDVTVHPDWNERGTCPYDIAILEVKQAAAVKTCIIARSPQYASTNTTVTIYDPRDELNFAYTQVVAHGNGLCPSLVGDEEGAFCIRMEADSIVPGSHGGPVIVLDLPPELDMENGDHHIDMVVGVLCGVDQFTADGGSAASAAEISRHTPWIKDVLSKTCKAQRGEDPPSHLP